VPRRRVLASVLHFGCGFFLLLAVINEDIMPGYTLVLIAMALAARASIGRPRPSSWASALVHAWLAARMAPDISDIAGVVGRARFVQPSLKAARLDGSPPARHNALGRGLVVLFWEGHNGAMDCQTSFDRQSVATAGRVFRWKNSMPH